ncbi:MAG: AAA family ATPase [Acidobacteriia bacterium]|nr:AAA family ATPase [Terriglobia bacterium]
MATEMNSPQSSSVSRSIRLIRPSVVVLCGPAACGKSTFAAKHFRPTQIISSDQARALVCDDERDQRFQTEAFALVHFLLEQRLSINRLCVVDSTALTAAARKSLLDLARRFHVPAVALLFDVPLEICLERDAQRERTVGPPAIERQHQLFVQAKSAIKQEGFDQVVELSAQDMGNVQTEIVFRPVPRPAPPNARPERRQSASRPAQPMAAEKVVQPENRAAPAPDRGAAD